MFRWFRSKERRLKDKFDDLQKADRPDHALAIAKELLDVAYGLEPWPFQEPPKHVFLSDVYFEIGRAHNAMPPTTGFDPYEHAIEAYKKSLNVLRRDEKRKRARANIFLAFAFADRIEGDLGQNTEMAIGYAETSLELLDPKIDRALIASTKGALASLIANSPNSTIKENTETAFELQLEAISLIDRRAEPYEWAMAQIKLADYLTKREVGTRTENVERALTLLDDASSEAQSFPPTILRAPLLETRFNCLVDRVIGDHTKNFDDALLVADELLALWAGEEFAERRASFQTALGIAWANRSYGDIPEYKKNARECFEAALAFFDEVRFPEQHRRVRSLLNESLLDSSPAFSQAQLDQAIANKLAQLRAIDRKTNMISWVDWSLDVCRLLKRDRSDARDASVEKAIELYEAMLRELNPSQHQEHWTKCVRGLVGALRQRRGEDLVETRIRIRAQLQILVDEIVYNSDPTSWIECACDLAEFTLSDIVGHEQDNIEKAIATLEIALVAATGNDHEHLRARAAYTLATLFKKRLRGDPNDNLLECAKYYTIVRPIVAKQAGSAALKSFDAELHEIVAKLQLPKAVGQQYSSKVVPPSPQHVELSAGQRRQEALALEAELLNQAALLSEEADLDEWVAIMLRVAEIQPNILPADDNADMPDWTDAIMSNNERAISTLVSIKNRLNKFEHPDKWATVHWRISGAARMAQLWADFRRTAGRKFPQDPVQVLKGSEKAREFLEVAAKALEEVVAIYPLEHSAKQFMENGARLGRFYMELGDFERSWFFFQRSSVAANIVLASAEFAAYERFDLLEALSDLASLAPIAAMELGRYTEALEISEQSRARILSEKLSRAAKIVSDEDQARLNDARALIVQAEKSLIDPWLFERNRYIDEIIRQKKCIASIVGQPDTGLAPALTKLDGLLGAAGRQAYVFLYMSEFGGFLSVFYSENARLHHDYERADETESLRTLFSEGMPGQTAAWQSRYLTAQTSTGSTDAEDWSVILRETSDLLGGSLANPLSRIIGRHEFLKSVDLELIFIPNGPIGYLPLSLAKWPSDDPQLLRDRATVSVLPSVGVAHINARTRERASSDEAIAICFTNRPPKPHEPLPFSEFEAESIARAWGASQSLVLNTDREDRQRVLEVLSTSDVWHLIGHGTMNAENPGASAVVLGGGTSLTVEDLMSFQPETQPRLVALSACSTGLYGLNRLPEEFIGLPSAFLSAGARGVIASLWPIDEVPAALMFKKLYNLMRSEGCHPRRALHLSQEWLRSVSGSEVLSELNDWRTFGLSTQEGQAHLSSVLDPLTADPCFVDELPFEDPSFWAGYVYIGA